MISQFPNRKRDSGIRGIDQAQKSKETEGSLKIGQCIAIKFSIILIPSGWLRSAGIKLCVFKHRVSVGIYGQVLPSKMEGFQRGRHE